jgi:isopenicillin N synthase-like dioxygenase
MANEMIPVIDLGPYLAGVPGAIDRIADELHFALTVIGFYFIINHNVPSEQIRVAFQQAARFHALPLHKKLEVKLDKHNVGYLTIKGDTLRTSTVETVLMPNINEAFFVARDLSSDHPEVLANRRFRSANRWPTDLPGFREAIVAYCESMEQLVRKLVRLYARALRLPFEYFDQPFREPQYKLRMTHYPYQADLGEGEFGIAPHTDTSFLTLLAPNDVPGLSIRTQSGNWIDAPAIPGAFVVNGGQLLQRWTNDYFLATPHRAVNRTGGARYALAFFLRQQYRLANRCSADLCRTGQAAEVSDHVLHGIHDPLPTTDLQCVRSRRGRRRDALVSSSHLIRLLHMNSLSLRQLEHALAQVAGALDGKRHPTHSRLGPNNGSAFASAS